SARTIAPTIADNDVPGFLLNSVIKRIILGPRRVYQYPRDVSIKVACTMPLIARDGASPIHDPPAKTTTRKNIPSSFDEKMRLMYTNGAREALPNSSGCRAESVSLERNVEKQRGVNCGKIR
ncbi:hypothetical protein K0M31_004572, partial [Melipona bicolor]